MKWTIVRVSFNHCFILLEMMWHIGNSAMKLLIEISLTSTFTQHEKNKLIKKIRAPVKKKTKLILHSAHLAILINLSLARVAS